MANTAANAALILVADRLDDVALYYSQRMLMSGSHTWTIRHARTMMCSAAGDMFYIRDLPVVTDRALLAVPLADADDSAMMVDVCRSIFIDSPHLGMFSLGAGAAEASLAGPHVTPTMVKDMIDAHIAVNWERAFHFAPTVETINYVRQHVVTSMVRMMRYRRNPTIRVRKFDREIRDIPKDLFWGVIKSACNEYVESAGSCDLTSSVMQGLLRLPCLETSLAHASWGDHVADTVGKYLRRRVA